MLKGIVFDLDGTLVDSLSVTFSGFNHCFTRQGLPELTPKEIMKHFGLGERQIFARMIGETLADQAYSDFVNYTQNEIRSIPLHEGAGDLIEYCKSKAIPISIVTGRSYDTTVMILKHHGIYDRFISIIAHDHVSLPKPSPEGILLALGKMKLSPKEIMYVGDSAMDVKAAQAAGSISVAALWDLLANHDELAGLNPHHMIRKPAELIPVWEKLKASSVDSIS